MDDVTVLGPAEVMPDIVRTSGQDIARLGMVLNTAKCQRMGLHQSAEDTLDGARIMGAYVGSNTYQQRQLFELFVDLRATLGRIVTEEPAVALPLLRYCVNARPVYVARPRNASAIRNRGYRPLRGSSRGTGGIRGDGRLPPSPPTNHNT
jgi:hypothetical protein